MGKVPGDILGVFINDTLIQKLKISGKNENYRYTGCAGISRLSTNPKQISAKAVRVVNQIAKKFGYTANLVAQDQTDIPYEGGDAILVDSIIIHVYDDYGTDILDVYVLSHDIPRLTKGCFVCFEVE